MSRIRPEIEAQIVSLLSDETLYLREIAEQASVGTRTVSRVMKRNSIKRKMWPKRSRLPAETIDLVLSLLATNTYTTIIARQAGVAPSTVRRIARANGMVPRRGPNHPDWKGGRGTDAHGYVRCWVDPSSVAYSMRSNNGRYLEHRVVMAEHLDRPLLPVERVHHINGDRTDNRIENLQLLKIGNHGSGTALICSDCGGTNIVHHELLSKKGDING